MAATGTRAGAAPDMAGFELAVGGMTCAACAARVQAKLNKVTGVTASVNLSTERAYVTAPAQFSARDLIDVVEAAGYTAELAAPAEQDAVVDATAAADEAAVRRLRRRLTLALVFFVPLTDLSLMLSVFPWTRFPGWQWLLVALAAPVAIWAAWPFHAAALRQARHLSSSMDTPGAPPGRPCATWPKPAPATSASWPTTVPSTGCRPGASGPASGSSSARGSGSPPTGRCCPAGPRWTAA